MLENSRNAVVVVRSAALTLAPGQTAPLTLQTAATRSVNRVGSGGYRMSSKIDLRHGRHGQGERA